MQRIAMLATLMAAAVLLPAEDATKKFAGIYEGTVDGKTGAVILNENGAAFLRPGDDQKQLEGTWKVEKSYIVVSVKPPGVDSGKIFIRFRIDRAELILSSVGSNDNEVKSFEPPLFKQVKTGKERHAGEYTGTYDGEKMHLTLGDGGAMFARPEDPDSDMPEHRGKWRAKNDIVTCTVDADGGDAVVTLTAEGKDLRLVKLAEPDGTVKKFKEVRFKNAKLTKPQKAPPAVAKKLAGIYRGKVEDAEAQIQIKADGSIIARPNLDQKKLILRGQWKMDGKLIQAKLTDRKKRTGTITLQIAEGNLILIKVTDPNGEVERFESQFKKIK